MSILFDLCATQPNSNGKRHGGGIYGEVVLRRIIERKLPVEVFFDSTKWLNPEMDILLNDNSIKKHDVHGKHLQDIIDSNKVDIIYSPLLENYYRGIERCKIKATIHGLRYLELPLDWNKFQYKKENNLKSFVLFILHRLFPSYMKSRDTRLLSWMFNPSYDIITVSNHSAYSIRLFYPELRNKVIKVFYSPLLYKEHCTEKQNVGKYFLLVSGNRWEKNNLRAIKALDTLFSNGALDSYNVIITGATSCNIFKYKIKNINKFIFKGYVSDEELTVLYNNAYCLIYPSLNEGFGYPPLESMRFGNPVLASSFSSISEVCGDAVLYFNPFSEDEIANRILMITNEAIYKEMSSRALRRFDFIKNRQIEDLDKLVDYIYNIREI